MDIIKQLNILRVIFYTSAICSACINNAFAEDKEMVVNTNTFHSYEFEKPNYHCNNLKVSGYMIGHYHGLPTNPMVSDADEHQCIVKGLMFNMPGTWKIKISRDDETVLILSFRAI